MPETKESVDFAKLQGGQSIDTDDIVCLAEVPGVSASSGPRFRRSANAVCHSDLDCSETKIVFSGECPGDNNGRGAGVRDPAQHHGETTF